MLTLFSFSRPVRRFAVSASLGSTLLSSSLLLSPHKALALPGITPVPASVLSHLVIGAPVSPVPRVLFGGTALPLPSADLAPFRDAQDGKVYVAPEMLAPLGVTFLVDEMQDKVALAGSEAGVSTMVDVRLRPGAEKSPQTPVFVPAQEVMEALGARCVWNAATNTLSIYSVVTDVQMIAGQLRVKATLPVLPKQVRSSEKPGMVILDFPGAVIEGQPRPLDLKAPGIDKARIGQFSQDTARIVLEMAGAAPATRYYVLGGKPAAQVVLNPTPLNAPSAIVISNNNPSRTMTARSGSGTAVKSARSAAVSKKVVPPTFIKGVTFRHVSDTQAQLVVEAGRAPEVRADLSKGRLTIDMVNATLGAAAGDNLNAAKHPFLRGISLVPRGSAAAQLVVDLTRTVTYAVRMSPTGGFVLDLLMPKSAGGRLAGKLVVIDPGHGGSDGGARGTDGSYEKNVTLAISTKLAATLRDMGANVIMTRGNDAFIPVNDRPKIANRAGADFFLSIHADSGSRNRTVNGSTIYYHMQVGSCKALAQSIVDQLADMGGIRTKGTHSDGMQWGGRFVNGYGVLRGAQMVSVLCETGYMSNPGDVNKLNDPVMQKKIADSIANGLKNYVEGNPTFDTRNIRPQAEGELAPLTPDDTTEIGASSEDDETASLGARDTRGMVNQVPGTPR
ncbi:MAG: N-acetylmuramoyl-L-alanine amidase [Armatimonadota bacterium]